MDARVEPVAPRATRHLIEFREVEIEMIEYDVAHVGEIDALAERRRRDDRADRAATKQRLDARAFRRGNAGVIEADDRTEPHAQTFRELRHLRARIAVHDRLALAVEFAREIGVLVRGVARVDEMEVLADRRIDHPRVDRERAADLAERILLRGRREREHLRRAELADEIAERAICGPMARFEDVVRFVDDHERGAIFGPHERVAMVRREFGRREDDVPRAVRERVVERRAFARVDRPVGPKDPQPEAVEASDQRFELIVRERAERIEHERLRAPLERRARGGELEAERLPATRAEDRERVVAGFHAVENRALCLSDRSLADQRDA